MENGLSSGTESSEIRHHGTLEGQSDRFLRESLFSEELCTDLIQIHRVCATPGYRDHYTSTLFGSCPPWAFPALVRARELVREEAERLFNLPLGLYVETSGTAGWHQGAEIPLHADNNRDYLSARHVSAVVWLNTCGQEFEGGEFYFSSSLPTHDSNDNPIIVRPRAGDAALFSSGPENRHGVKPVLSGIRYSFLVWMTQDEEHSEDVKVARGLELPASLSAAERLFGLGPQTLWRGSVECRRLAQDIAVSLDLRLCNNESCSLYDSGSCRCLQCKEQLLECTRDVKEQYWRWYIAYASERARIVGLKTDPINILYTKESFQKRVADSEEIYQRLRIEWKLGQNFFSP